MATFNTIFATGCFFIMRLGQCTAIGLNARAVYISAGGPSLKPVNDNGRRTAGHCVVYGMADRDTK